MCDKLGFIGEFKKLVCVQKGELPQSTSLTAPCRREPQSYFNLNGKISLFCSNGINFTNFFDANLTLASLRQGGGKIEDFDGGSSSFSESYFHVEREDDILHYGVGANNVR